MSNRKNVSTNGQFVSCVSSNATEPENLWAENRTMEYACSLNYNEVPVWIPANSERDGKIIEKVQKQDTHLDLYTYHMVYVDDEMFQPVTGKTVWHVISQAIQEDARCRSSNNYKSSNHLKPGTVTGETNKIQLTKKCTCVTHSTVVTKVTEPP